MRWFKSNWFKILAIGLLLGAQGTHPYAYYQILRWVVCTSAAYTAYLYFKSERRTLFSLFLATAVLFNPIAPVYLNKDTWQTLDLVFAAIFAMSLFIQKQKQATS